MLVLGLRHFSLDHRRLTIWDSWHAKGNSMRKLSICKLIVASFSCFLASIASVSSAQGILEAEQAVPLGQRAVPMMRLNQALFTNNTNVRYSLQNLLQIKLDEGEDGPRFICMLETAVEEIVRKREHQIQIVQREVNTREVVDGVEKDVQKTVEVKVPVVVESQQVQTTRRGKKPTFVDWNRAKLCRLDGTALTLEEAREALQKLQTVFLANNLERPLDGASNEILKVLNPNALVFITDDIRPGVNVLKRERAEEQP